MSQAARPRLNSMDCLTIIEQRLPAMSGASRRVAEAIMRDPWAVLGMTIYDVAETSGVSLPSVTRFCRAIGFPGFRELVQGVAQSLGRLDSKDLESLEPAEGADGLLGLAARIVGRQVEALQNTLRTLDYDALEQAASIVAGGERVTVVGSGGAYVSALGTAIKLNWAGVAASAATPDIFSNQMIAVGRNDVVIAVSHQGRTRDVIETVRVAQAFGAKTISISTVANAPLATVADIALAVFSPDLARAGTFLIAHNAELVLADILAATVADRKWGGTPPQRDAVVDWIEKQLRVGPTGSTPARRPRSLVRADGQQPHLSESSHG